MIQTFKQLKNLPVYSKSNDFLGKIKNIEINCDSHIISRYIIKSSDVVKRISGKEIIISPSQVISLDEQKMVVEDNLLKDEDLVKEPVAV
jgi:sporulation protein YlmC with PRC-barrel domain